MAVYFLEKSETYRASVDDKVFKRREIVCKHLNENYKAGKNKNDIVFARASEDLKAYGIDLSKPAYQADKVLIRAAFVYLMANTDAEREDLIAKTAGIGMVGINCLRRDGIKTWNELMGVVPPMNTEEQAEDSVQTRFRLADLKGGSLVVGILNDLTENLELMLNEDDLLRQENKRLNIELSEQIAKSSDSEGYIGLLESENASLEQQLREAKELARRAHSASLVTLAQTYPEISELLVASQKIKQSPSRREEIIRELLVRLPVRFNWPNETGEIQYDNHFLSQLATLTSDEQNQVTQQVGVLATEGSEYASLHTRKSMMRIPFSPFGCMVSRGSQSIRFTWKKNGAITLFWLYRKGDSRVRVSEQ